jgi:hypothetical protein
LSLFTVAKAIEEEVSAAVKGSGVVGGIGVGDSGGGQRGVALW